MSGKFTLKKSAHGQFMFNLVASNGRIILTSETYIDKSGAKNGIESVKKHSGNDTFFKRQESNKGESYFILKAANGETICKSEMYSSETAMENGITSVKANAPNASIEDLT